MRVCVQPKFLTKAERAALALQRRQEEAAGVRAQQDEMRRLQREQQQVGQDEWHLPVSEAALLATQQHRLHALP